MFIYINFSYYFQVLFDGISVSSSNTTDGFDIAEALLKAELKTHELQQEQKCVLCSDKFLISNSKQFP